MRIGYEAIAYTRIDGGSTISGLSPDQVRRRRHLLTPVAKSPGVFVVHERGAGFFPGERLELDDPPVRVSRTLRPLHEAAKPQVDRDIKPGKSKGAKAGKAKPTRRKGQADPSDMDGRLELVRAAFEELGEAALAPGGGYDLAAFAKVVGFEVTLAELSAADPREDVDP